MDRRKKKGKKNGWLTQLREKNTSFFYPLTIPLLSPVFCFFVFSCPAHVVVPNRVDFWFHFRSNFVAFFFIFTLFFFFSVYVIENALIVVCRVYDTKKGRLSVFTFANRCRKGKKFRIEPSFREIFVTGRRCNKKLSNNIAEIFPFGNACKLCCGLPCSAIEFRIEG